MCVSQQELCIAIETQHLIPSRCKLSRLRLSPDVKRRPLISWHSKDNSSHLISLLLSCTFFKFSLSRVEKEPLDPREMMESQVNLDQMWVVLDALVLMTVSLSFLSFLLTFFIILSLRLVVQVFRILHITFLLFFFAFDLFFIHLF